MENEIKVINITTSNDFNKIIKLYNDTNINKTFDGYRIDRISCAEINFLILLDDKPIGFILLVKENQRKNSLAIDIALKEKYRNKGYGKKALEIFKNKFLKLISEDIYIQIKKEYAENNMITNILNAKYIESTENSNFYKV